MSGNNFTNPDSGLTYKRTQDRSYNNSTGAGLVQEIAPAQFTTITVTLHNAITSPATSAAVDVSNYSRHSIQFRMTTSHSSNIQASIDGTNYVTIGSAVTTNTIISLDAKYKFLRVDTTAVSGALTVTLISGA